MTSPFNPAADDTAGIAAARRARWLRIFWMVLVGFQAGMFIMAVSRLGRAWAVASDSARTGPASTRRGPEQRTHPCASRVMAA